MARPRMLRLLPVVLGLSLMLSLPNSADPLAGQVGSCPALLSAQSACATLLDGSVVLGAEDRRSGIPGSPNTPGTTVEPNDGFVPAVCPRITRFGRVTTCLELPQASDDAAVHDILITDFIAFAPVPGVPRSEPGAFAVRNLHTNFTASAWTHTREGLLLGQPASAEFTPVAYEWHYGDGATTVTASPGTTWQALGLAEFSATPTSHVYTARGSYAVTLTTYYTVRAAYAADGLWWQLRGVLPITSGPTDIRVVTVNTVLVDKDCHQNPRGPGC